MTSPVTRPGREANLPGRFAVAHALALIVFLSWRFGGMEPWGRVVAGWACGLAPLVTVFAWNRADAAWRRKFLGIALPLAGIGLLVFTSALNPHMRVLDFGGEAVL